MMKILAIDRNWEPHRWIALGGQDGAIMLEAKGLVLDHLGEAVYVFHGGTNKAGVRSVLETSSIIVVNGAPNPRKHRDPVLTNASLFQRDRQLCAYCGGRFKQCDLTRDHIHPTSHGGRDTWMNVVTACRRCNALKGSTRHGEHLPNKVLGPQLTGKMLPLYLPYVPCRAESMILKERAIKFDQMSFLLERVKNKHSRIFAYAEELLGRGTMASD